jgi:hypothetical protein
MEWTLSSQKLFISVRDVKGGGGGGAKENKLHAMALVRERTIPTEGTPPVGEVSANFCG